MSGSWLARLARVAVAAILLWAAWSKLLAPNAFLASVRGYGVFGGLAGPVAASVPWLEIVLAAVLLAGDLGGREGLARAAAWTACAVFMVFLALLGWSLIGGGSAAGCGCFGVGGRVTPMDLVRDAVFLVLAVIGARGGRAVGGPE